MRWRELLVPAARSLAGAYGLAGPFKATLALTYRCPRRCYFCGIYRRDEPELSAEDWAAALAGLESVTWVDVTGGEIFARPDALDVCSRVVEALPSLCLFHFPTSGAWPGEAVTLARAIAARGVRVVVSVAVQGPRALHDRVSGAPGAFDQALETFRLLRALPRVDTVFGATLLKENIQLVPEGLFDELARHVGDLRKGDLHVNRAQRSGHYFSNDAMELPAGAAVSSAMRRLLQWKGLPRTPMDALEAAYRLLAVQDAEGASGRLPTCAALHSSVFVSPSGTVYPCHIWAEPLGLATRGTNIAALVAGERGRWLRSQVARGLCPGCWTPCEAYPTLLTAASNPLYCLQTMGR
jgi:MoaA/NifB/PqqE/SkfB family radical SAM enzyme